MYKHLFTTIALVLVTGCAAEEASQNEEDLRGSEVTRVERAELRSKVETAITQTTLSALADSSHPCLSEAMRRWDTPSNSRTSAAGTFEVDGKTILVLASFDRFRNDTFIEALVALDGKLQLLAAGGKRGVLLALDERLDVEFGQPSQAYPFMGLDACR